MPLAVAQVLLFEARWPAGLLLVAAGEGLRIWAAGHIGRPSRTRDASVGPLVRGGPYARCRNPLYVGNALMATGFGMLAHPALAVAWALLTAGFYSLVVRWEERRLLQEHGQDYADYLQRVPRWLPLGAARAGDFSLGRGLRSERSTLLVWALLLSLQGLA